MLIGVPKEIKNHEYRVGLTPSSAREFILHGHQVTVQRDAGLAIGLTNEAYLAAGAHIVDSAAEIFQRAEMIIKVKEPQPQECQLLREGQLLFTYLHLAPDPEQTKLLLASGCVAVAYETVTNDRGGLPLLAPMSEVAGRMSIQAAAASLEKSKGGAGLLLGGVPGVPPAKVVILGGGVVGTNAIQIAVGMGAQVTVLDKSIHRLRELDALYGNRLCTAYSTATTVDELLIDADVIIGAVLIPGASAPKIVKKTHLQQMRPGSVLVDVAIDQGGCAETSRATTHAEPTYVEEGIVHYCVANMPGAVARTSTFALNNVTLPFGLALANQGYQKALREDPHLRNGLNIAFGKVTYLAVAQDLGYSYTDPLTILR